MLDNTIFDGYILTSSGAMVDSGWGKVKDKWYYAKPSGKISQQKWEKVGGVWYYFDKDGIMLSNTIFNGYLFSNSGAMAENSWVKHDGKSYYALSSGKAAQQKWEKIAGSWYYFNKDASMANNQWQGNYYLKANGVMAEKEWIFDKGYNNWFYIQEGGLYVRNKWLELNQEWYFFKNDGQMAQREWVGDYYLKADGKIEPFSRTLCSGES